MKQKEVVYWGNYTLHEWSSAKQSVKMQNQGTGNWHKLLLSLIMMINNYALNPSFNGRLPIGFLWQECQNIKYWISTKKEKYHGCRKAAYHGGNMWWKIRVRFQSGRLEIAEIATTPWKTRWRKRKKFGPVQRSMVSVWRIERGDACVNPHRVFETSLTNQ